MSAPILRCTGLTARHNGRELYVDAEVSLPEATLTVLQGPSGTGKTTLLRQLVGLEHAPEARRWLEGQEYGRKELAEWRARVTLAAQDAPILDDTVERNLAFPYGFRTAARRELPVSDAQELLERCGLGSIAFNQRVAVLSGGERHRLALVRAVLWDPVVLVADEPLAGLDSGVAETCWQLLGEHAHRSGRAVLCTLHDDTMAERADRRVELSDGSIRELEVRSP